MKHHAYLALIHTSLDKSWIRRIMESIDNPAVEEACLSQHVHEIFQAMAESDPPEGDTFWSSYYISEAAYSVRMENKFLFLSAREYDYLLQYRATLKILGVTDQQVADHLMIPLSEVTAVTYGTTRYPSLVIRLRELITLAREQND